MKYLEHYGTPRHSGRYPWGSGKNPQRNRNFIQRADDLAAQGLSRKEIATAMGLSTGQYTAMRKIYKNQIDTENQIKAIKLKDKGWANTKIAEELGVSEGTVRNYLDPNRKRRENVSQNIADNLKELLKEKPYLDIGEGSNRQLGISEEQMKAARLILEDEGYSVLSYKLPQINNPNQHTNLTVLCPPDTTMKDLNAHIGEITSPDGLYFKDYGETAVHRKPIPSLDSKRIAVRYQEDGGGDKDGVIELRPGTEDLSLGGRRYAQVRIGVDGTHYLKGMAIYGTDMPDGVDIVFNTSKHKDTPMLGDGDNTVLKPMKKDPSNPFGSAFRQWDYEDANGVSHTSPINIVNDDEDWEGWKKNLSSQFLSKQPLALAKKQLDLRYGEYQEEFNELKSLTNPTLKRQLCEDFADTCDAAAVHLKAAALPRQGSFAILPVTSLKDNEVYAPMYDDGEEVVLIRHPHAGTFEIPRLTVNNRNREGKESLGPNPPHAIGINPTVAQQLSGADFDGDTVLVIPTKGQNIKTAEPLEGLKGFSPTESYSRSSDDPIVTGKSRDGKKGDGFNKGMQMGMVSNLINDMTIKKANLDEIERAVRHSMVVIDAEKHNLDWQRSERDNGIAQLRELYQDGGGASTLISRAKREKDYPQTKPVYSVKDMTDEQKARYNAGEIIEVPTNKTKPERKQIKDPAKMTPEEIKIYESGKPVYRNTGKYVPIVQKQAEMEVARDARELSSGRPIEEVYAAYANQMKALANEARKESRTTGKLTQNDSAKKTYAEEIKSLDEKIKLAEAESPKERQAQAIATSVMRARVESDPSLRDRDNRDKYKKLSQKALNDARDQVNGGIHKKRYQIELTDREWDAIQAGAISDNRMRKVLQYSDTEKIKKRAMPRQDTGMKASAKARARMLLNSGVPLSVVAKDLGVSTSTLAKEFDNFKSIEGGD